MNKIIEVKNLTKIFRVIKPESPTIRKIFFPSYNELLAAADVSFDIEKGEIFGILGPNGAGKTTIIKILCGLLQPTKGDVLIDKKGLEENKYRIGLMLGNTMIYYRITGYDNLEYFARLYGISNYKERIMNLALLVGLEDWLDEYVERYSEGMKTKLAFARALIHDPDIIFLAEPTLGLDPHISFQIRNKIQELKQSGKTVILTTHYMEEADYLCDRVGILNHGRLIKVDSPCNLKKSTGRQKATLEDAFIELTGEGL